MQDFAVDANFLRARIDARAELGDDLAIDLDAAVEDQLLALASAGDAASGEHLLQPLGALGVGHGIGALGATASTRERGFGEFFSRAFGHAPIIGGGAGGSQGQRRI